jgi:Ca2+/Na+ antiporter
MLCLHVHVVFLFFFIDIIFNHASSVFLQVMFYVFIIFLVYSPASKRNLGRRLNFHGTTTKNSSLQINILVRCICFVFLIHAITLSLYNICVYLRPLYLIYCHNMIVILATEHLKKTV